MPENSYMAVIQKRDAFETLSQESAIKKEPSTELTALSRAFSMAFWQEPKNYNKIFELASKLKNKLDKVNDKQFAGRRDAYVELGTAYYILKDYAVSLELLENVIHTTPLSFWDRSHLEALRISGICYANIPGEMMRSDSCFMAMMLCDDMVFNRPVYDALALSNLGSNAMMQGNFDKALAIDLEVVPPLKQEAASTQLYSDSLVAAYKLVESKYASQFISNSWQNGSNQEIGLHRRQVERIRNFIVLVLIIFILISIGMAGTLQLHRKRNATYKALARKAKEFARESVDSNAVSLAYAKSSMNTKASDDDENSNALKEEPTQEDLNIMSLVEQRIVVEYAYREINLKMDDLADQLGLRRHALSRAINCVTGGNFYQYINSYRIKEAVRLISQTKHNELFINDLFERVGFANRTTFYRVFKQFTGLSPIVFQKNCESDRE